MCGIAGVVSTDSHPPNAAAAEELIACMSHRGPDSHGSYTDDRLAPETGWFCQSLSDIFALFRRGRVLERGWVHRDEIERLVAFSSRADAGQVWRLLILETSLGLNWARDRATTA